MPDTPTPARVLVTGASGLLGTAVVRRLAGVTAVLPLGHVTALPGVRPADLLAEGGVDALDREEWDAVVHCAAYRSPDFCEEHREAARRLNAGVPGELARLAARRGALMVHISTDYVFDGSRPPYAESSPTGPVNYYGASKLEGEVRVRAAWPRAAILRVPALYGSPPPPLRSPILEEAIQAAVADAPPPQDDSIVRHPTHVADVAEVVWFLLATRFAGTLHASAPERATRYAWARAIAAILGTDPGRIPLLGHDPNRKAPRPVNARLSTDALQALGGPVPRGFAHWLPIVLAERGLIRGAR